MLDRLLLNADCLLREAVGAPLRWCVASLPQVLKVPEWLQRCNHFEDFLIFFSRSQKWPLTWAFDENATSKTPSIAHKSRALI